MLRLFVAAVLAAVPFRAWAQDAFEIQVYEYDLVPQGLWDLETHVNYTVHGSTSYEGALAPTQGQTHLSFELTRGISSWFETAVYLVTAHRSVGGSGSDVVGWRFRPRFRLPEDWLPVKVSISTEFGFPGPMYEPNAMTFELRPILERAFGPAQVDVNPTLSKAVRGPDAHEGWELEPAARFAYTTSPKLDLTLEYYGGLGPMRNVLPADEQVHQFFPGADINLTKNIVLNLGVGFGATSVGNTLVYKTRLGWIFGG